MFPSWVMMFMTEYVLPTQPLCSYFSATFGHHVKSARGRKIITPMAAGNMVETLINILLMYP